MAAIAATAAATKFLKSGPSEGSPNVAQLHRKTLVRAGSSEGGRSYSYDDGAQDDIGDEGLSEDEGGGGDGESGDGQEDFESLSAAAALLSKLWRKRRHGVVQFDLTSQAPLRLWRSGAEVSRELGINKGNLSKCVRGKYRSSGGFGWRAATQQDFDFFAPTS